MLLAVGGGLLLIWAVSLYGLLHLEVVYALALVPRAPDGAIGILTMPLVHGSIQHLVVNSVSFAALAAVLAARSASHFLYATLLILLVGGSALWIVGREGAHIGASLLVFGYFGLLATRGFFEQRLLSIVVSIVVIGLYAGLLWGIVPNEERISWEGHLLGLLAGIFAARVLSRRGAS